MNKNAPAKLANRDGWCIFSAVFSMLNVYGYASKGSEDQGSGKDANQYEADKAYCQCSSHAYSKWSYAQPKELAQIRIQAHCCNGYSNNPGSKAAQGLPGMDPAGSIRAVKSIAQGS